MISSDSRDLAPARMERMLDLLRSRRFARVQDLCRELQASAATVRRDLLTLDRKGQIRRVHGGAMLIGGLLDEPLFDDKTEVAAAEKQRIAEAARTFVLANDTIYLDGGSTVLALAHLLADTPNLTIVTNSLRVASALAGHGPRTIVIGGELRRRSQTFVGSLTRHQLEHLHVDKAFLGTIGLSSETGMTTTDPREAHTKELVIHHANQVILLADHTKVGKVSFVTFGRLSDVDVLVTDSGVPKAALQALRKQGVEILTV
jgi:DeoR/GlpR family transcriptional regulator of sugar metabolism